jgi:lipopolysaccharide cholinephosphotransferase
MRELTVQELRSIQLEILEEVSLFCQEHKIRYSLCGGTLLGAVRHKGYIPWDDDIDIMMPRADYDRFVSIYSSSKNYVFDFSQEKGYRETFVKICRRNTCMIDGLLNRNDLGVNIDLFPIDGVPSDNTQSYVQNILNFKEKIAKYCPYYIGLRGSRIRWFVKYIIKRLISFNFTPILKYKAQFSEMLRSSDFETCNFAGVISGSYGFREVVPQSVFLSYQLLDFENRKFYSIENYDEYLRSIYGDYMALPPEEKRIAPHNYKAYVLKTN